MLNESVVFLFKGKSDEQLENEKNWLDCERLWLMHKSGFTAVRLMSRSHESGKVGIYLEATGEQATVDEDDVELVRVIVYGKGILLDCTLCVIPNSNDCRKYIRYYALK